MRFVTNGRLLRRDAADDIVALPAQGLLQAFSAVRTEQASADFKAIAASVDRATLAAHHAALEGEDDARLPGFAPIAQTETPGVRAFLRSLLAAHARICLGEGSDDIASPLLQEVLIYQFLGAWPRLSSFAAIRQPTPPSRRVRLALDFIEANIATQLRLSDIAEACGIGVRSLQLLFKRELGRTVVQVIIDERLDRVRADLLANRDPGALVSRIAARWGFHQMGDFSRRYRERFGDPPSRTLRNQAH